MAELLFSNTGDNFNNVDYEADSGDPCFDNVKFTVIPDPDNSQNNVLRVYQPGDGSCLDAGDRHRAQMVALGTNGSALDLREYGVPYWFGVRCWVQDIQFTSVNQFSYFNIKGNNAGELNLILEGSISACKLRVHAKYTTASNTAVTTAENEYPIPTRQWFNLVIETVRATDTTGYVNVWLDTALDGNYTELTNSAFENIRTACDPSIIAGTIMKTRFGVYWGSQNSGDARLYFDEWRIARGANGFNDVDPNQGGIIIPPTIDFPPEGFIAVDNTD